MFENEHLLFIFEHFIPFLKFTTNTTSFTNDFNNNLNATSTSVSSSMINILAFLSVIITILQFYNHLKSGVCCKFQEGNKMFENEQKVFIFEHFLCVIKT